MNNFWDFLGSAVNTTGQVAQGIILNDRQVALNEQSNLNLQRIRSQDAADAAAQNQQIIFLALLAFGGILAVNMVRKI